MIEHRAVLGIAHNHLAVDILARQVGTHVEFAGVSRRGNFLGGAEKLNLIAEFDRMTPAREKLRAAGSCYAIDLDGLRLEEE